MSRCIYKIGGSLKTPEGMTPITPRSFVVHPPGEAHAYTNGPERTLLLRVRYGKDMVSRHKEWTSNPAWKSRKEDQEYFAQTHPGS